VGIASQTLTVTHCVVRLPSNAIIAQRKLRDYLLTRRVEDDKSGFLAVAGYSQLDSGRLEADLRSLLDKHDGRFLEMTEYGEKYEIRGAITGPNGRTLRVVTIWMTEIATGQAKFITLYPDKT